MGKRNHASEGYTPFQVGKVVTSSGESTSGEKGDTGRDGGNGDVVNSQSGNAKVGFTADTVNCGSLHIRF